MGSKTKLACLLSVWLVGCIATAASQQLSSQTEDLEDTTKDPQRWKTSGDDIVLLVRKVDEEHPYFKSMMFRKSANKAEILPKLTEMITHHCNTTNITMLVKNDLLVLRNAEDGAGLTSGDRIEAWTAIRGLATRSKTSMTFAKYVREGRLPNPLGPPMSGSGSSGPHHGGGGSGGGGGSSSGGGRRDRKDRKDRRAAVPSGTAQIDDIFNSIELDGF